MLASLPDTIPEGVATTLIGAVVTLLVAIVGLLGIILPLLLQARGHARRADHQVSNDHTTNLRDDQDGLRQLIVGVASDVRGLRIDIGRLYDHDDAQAERIRQLETTQDRKALLEHARHAQH